MNWNLLKNKGIFIRSVPVLLVLFGLYFGISTG